MLLLVRVLALAVLFVCAVSAGQSPPLTGTKAEGSGRQTALSRPNQKQGAAGLAVATIPSYPDSPGGLENLFKDMLNLENQRDRTRLTLYFQSLVLPHAGEWFTSKFGDQNCGDPQMAANDCLGSRLALTYASTARTLPAAAEMTMRDLLGDDLTNFEAVNHTELCAGPQRIIPARKLVDELTTTPMLSPVLSGLVQNHEPVYVLWAYSETKETSVAFFVYAEGAFRYIGMPHPSSSEDYARNAAAAQAKIELIRPDSNAVPSDDLTNEVVDVQPVLADQKLVERTVVLHVVIEADGTVREASYVRGPEEFKDAAIQSVKQRNFGPQGFAGHPARVETCISVDSHP
jgi:hypothetical protein